MLLRQLGLHFAIVALVSVLAFSSSTTAWAQDASVQKIGNVVEGASVTEKSSAPRLNLVDRQRMLGEMLAKGLCLIDLRVDKKMHRNQMSVAQYVFHSTLDHLIEGSVGLELAPETHPDLKKAIEDIKLAWVKYAEPLNSWTGGRWGKKQFAIKVYEVDEDYEKQLTEAIELYRTVLVDQGNISKNAAATILAAGRQRTLAQQSAKQFCQLLSGYKPDQTPDRLKETLSLYKDVADKFANGDKAVGLTEAPPGLVLDNLDLAQASFAKLEPIYTAAIEGSKPTPEQLSVVSATNLELLRHWEKIVSTYVLLN